MKFFSALEQGDRIDGVDGFVEVKATDANERFLRNLSACPGNPSSWPPEACR